MRYSFLNLLKQSYRGHKSWQPAWRPAKLKPSYDVVIIGGGGHGLATAYYLANEFKIRNIAVLEKGYIGGGNTGRNTTIIRSNYLRDDTARLYNHSLDLWQDLSRELNFNVMYSGRGVYNLGHSLQDMRDIERRVTANILNGIKSEVVSPAEIKKRIPIINISPKVRYPILGASYQERGGVARHDAVAWGFARAASDLGVDIIQNCEVQGMQIQNGRIVGLHSSQGDIKTEKVGVAVAGHSSVLAAMAGIRLPIISRPLQACVSEPLKPILNTVVMSGQVHGYISQSNKGDIVMGGGVDGYTGYSQRGSPHINEHTIQSMIQLFPFLSRVRMNRQWAGIVDILPDASPIVGKTPVKNLYINCGWGTGGFKATPGSGHVFAHTIAHDEPSKLNAAFTIDRFVTGSLVDEQGASGVAQH
ncbi:MAG: sarcosine oxidase subunit beta family protein [Gammaproteobacteria bacterium]|nr:sarcosine oxidase subunit beta family protein [Gammaproteobacteria bacterium]